MSLAASATEALNLRVQLTQDLTYSAIMHFNLHQTARSMANPDAGHPILPKGTTGRQVGSDMLTTLRSAKTYLVTPDMTTLAAHAAEKLPNDAVVHPHHVPHPTGFLWLPEPFRMLDIRGKVMSMNAILWSVRGDQIVIWWLADRNDPVDSMNVEYRMKGFDLSKMPRLQPSHLSQILIGEPLPTSVELQGQKLIPPGTKVDVKETPAGLTWFIGDDGLSPTDMLPTEVPSRHARFLTVLWRLMQQTITDVREEPMPRGPRRQAERAGVEDTGVTVITLRRKVTHSEDGESSPVDWKHRWVVDSYWRNQWYGSGDNRWQEVILVSAHMKGPEDAPLKINNKVSALIR